MVQSLEPEGRATEGVLGWGVGCILPRSWGCSLRLTNSTSGGRAPAQEDGTRNLTGAMYRGLCESPEGGSGVRKVAVPSHSSFSPHTDCSLLCCSLAFSEMEFDSWAAMLGEWR